MSPGRGKPIFGDYLYPVGSRTWGSEEGDVVAPESGAKGQKPSPPSHSLPTAHLPEKQSFKSRKEAQAGVPGMWAQGLHLEQIKSSQGEI